jgi:predicted dehydrogenase
MEALAAPSVGVAGLGPWGSNLARNFHELTGLAWVCDEDEGRLAAAAARYPGARATARFEDLLEDEALQAVVVATSVPTHAELARRALAAGKHVFVEKPMALSGADAEGLVELAGERERVLLPGHLLLYHPGVVKLKELVDAGELGEILYVYGNRQNLGTIRHNENALWSLGVHDLSVILYLLGEKPSELWARGESFLKPGVEDVVFCYLRFPSGKAAHMHLSWLDPHKMRRMTVVGTERMAVFDDMELDRKVTVYDSAAEHSFGTYGEWRTRVGDVHSPRVANDEPLRLECAHFLALVGGEGDPLQAAREGLAVVRSLEQLQAMLERESV